MIVHGSVAKTRAPSPYRRVVLSTGQKENSSGRSLITSRSPLRGCRRVMQFADEKSWHQSKPRSCNGRFLRHRFSPKAKSVATQKQFTKKKPRCQRGGVHGVANQPASSKRPTWQTKRCSSGEAVALRKIHVMRRTVCGERDTAQSANCGWRGLNAATQEEC